MSLKNILLGIGKKVFGKKPNPSPATGKSQKLLTYEGKAAQETGQELVEQEMRNPPVVLKKTQALQMGDDTAPAFGSSTYDWVMKKGRGRYTADEWVDHLTSTRKENFTVFGKPSSRILRTDKRFKYDSGPFMGKEVNISKEELFDSNLASFNEAGDLTGGLLAAGKKFGIKFDANEIGAFIKLNPINRLRPTELGLPKGVKEKFNIAVKNLDDNVQNLKRQFPGDPDIERAVDAVRYELQGIKDGNVTSAAFNQLRESLRQLKARPMITQQQKVFANKLEADLNASAAPMRFGKTQYANEKTYTLEGGQNYRETIFTLDEPILSNTRQFNTGGHFGDILGTGKNNIYHVRYDTRITPDGKKAFLIHEIQSDVNQGIAKKLSKAQQLDGVNRVNPFQKDIEFNLLLNERDRLVRATSEALRKGDTFTANTLSNQSALTSKELFKYASKRGKQDYFPMVEADQYGDHAMKYLMQKAARENVDYVAVAPFDKLSFRQGFKKGNERFYGYASGKGINKSGTAVMPNLMKKAARFYSSQAGPIKLSLSDPKLPYKQISTNKFVYPKDHKLSGKEIRSVYHEDAVKDPRKGYKLLLEDNPNLYFNSFAIKVNPLMRGTQKTYKAKGGLVVDIFKPIRYYQPWQ